MTTLTTDQRLFIEHELARRHFCDFLPYCHVPTKDGLQPMEDWSHFTDRQYSPQGVSFDEAFFSGRDMVVLKARQLGVTTRIAAAETWEAETAPSVLPDQLFSLGEDEAKEFLRRIVDMALNLPPELHSPFQKTPSATEAKWKSRARVLAFPATKKAGRSFSTRRAVFDEHAFHEFAQENYFSVEPQAQQVVQVSTITTETNQGFFALKFHEAWHDPASKVAAFFFPWWVRPDRQNPDGSPNWDWYAEKKAKYAGFETDFKAEFPSTPQDAFGSKEGLVYPMYDERKHVLEQDPFRWEDAKTRVVGVDWGGGDPTAIVALGMSGTGKIHQFEEFYERGAISVEQIGQWIMARHSKGPVTAIFCDPSEPVAIASLRAAGLYAVPADNRRDAIGLTAGLLDQGRLSLAVRCVDSRKEFAGYKWRHRLDPNSRDRYRTGTPVDHHADAMDARRYALVGLLKSTEMYPQSIVNKRDYYGRLLDKKAV